MRGLRDLANLPGHKEVDKVTIFEVTSVTAVSATNLLTQDNKLVMVKASPTIEMARFRWLNRFLMWSCAAKRFSHVRFFRLSTACFGRYGLLVAWATLFLGSRNISTTQGSTTAISCELRARCLSFGPDIGK